MHPFKLAILESVLLIVIIFGCKEIVSPEIPISINNIWNLCYVKGIDNNWEVVINNRGSIKNISNTPKEDNYPQWSQDGKYIIYVHFTASAATDIYRYDIEKDSTLNLTSDSESYQASRPRWAPDGQKIYFGYHQIGGPYMAYIMDKDGTNKRKIIEQNPGIYSYPDVYFYNDSYNFIYVVDRKKVYKSNIDNTINEFLFDIYQELNTTYIAIQGFNTITEDLLITKRKSDEKNEIVTYNIKTRILNIMLTSSEGHINQIKYSKDFSKIALVEAISGDEEYLSILENGEKKRLVQLDTHSTGSYETFNYETFSYNPMQFSSDGRYLAFSQIIWGTSLIERLFIVDVTNGDLQFIDSGHHPSWNPYQ